MIVSASKSYLGALFLLGTLENRAFNSFGTPIVARRISVSLGILIEVAKGTFLHLSVSLGTFLEVAKGTPLLLSVSFGTSHKS